MSYYRQGLPISHAWKICYIIVYITKKIPICAQQQAKFWVRGVVLVQLNAWPCQCWVWVEWLCGGQLADHLSKEESWVLDDLARCARESVYAYAQELLNYHLVLLVLTCAALQSDYWCPCDPNRATVLQHRCKTLPRLKTMTSVLAPYWGIEIVSGWDEYYEHEIEGVGEVVVWDAIVMLCNDWEEVLESRETPCKGVIL